MPVKLTGEAEKMYRYVFRDEVVEYNRSPFGILFNVTVGLVRICIALPTLSHLFWSIPFYMNVLLIFSLIFSKKNNYLQGENFSAVRYVYTDNH